MYFCTIWDLESLVTFYFEVVLVLSSILQRITGLVRSLSALVRVFVLQVQSKDKVLQDEKECNSVSRVTPLGHQYLPGTQGSLPRCPHTDEGIHKVLQRSFGGQGFRNKYLCAQRGAWTCDLLLRRFTKCKKLALWHENTKPNWQSKQKSPGCTTMQFTDFLAKSSWTALDIPREPYFCHQVFILLQKVVVVSKTFVLCRYSAGKVSKVCCRCIGIYIWWIAVSVQAGKFTSALLLNRASDRERHAP